MKNKSLIALYFCYFLILCFVTYYPKFNKTGKEATISYDVAGYYAYLPAIFIYKDIHQLAFLPELNKKYTFADDASQGVLLPNGNYAMKYPIGAAIFYSPFFFIAHIYASISDDDADGYSYPYQLMISIGCLFYAFIGLFFIHKILLHYFSELTTAITLILLTAATNYLNYAAIDNALTHNLLFTLFTIIIWLTIQFYTNPKIKTAGILGLLCGLAIITRPTDILCILIPLLWGVVGVTGLKQRLQFLIRNYKMTITFILGAFITGCIQLIYWKITTGQILFYSYGEQTFSWRNPHILEGLFSYKKGWVTYTPIVLCILPGLFFLYKNKKGLFLPIMLFIAFNIYIAFSWDIWWYGGSLGQRSMVESYAIGLIPIAALVEQILKGNKIRVIVFSTIALFCTWYNIILTFQAHGKYGVLDDNAMNKAYFWKVFGKTKIDLDDKKFLDSFDRHKGAKLNQVDLYFNDFENENLRVDSNAVMYGNKSLMVTNNEQYTPSYNIPFDSGNLYWLNISADFYFENKEWNVWQMPQFILQFKQKDDVVKARCIRIHRIMQSGEKKNLNFDVKIPSKAFDTIEFYIWNAGSGTTTYIDNVHVYAFK